MYESARNALYKLIEFEPDRSGAIVAAYCNELALFAYLKENYPDDFLGRRLDIRLRDYSAVEGLAAHINLKYEQALKDGKKPNNWEKAFVTVPEMLKRYEAMLAECETIDKAKPTSQIAAIAAE